jgi:hypothetical protein
VSNVFYTILAVASGAILALDILPASPDLLAQDPTLGRFRHVARVGDQVEQARRLCREFCSADQNWRRWPGIARRAECLEVIVGSSLSN